MEDYYTIVFDDQTDEFGNKKEFSVLRYSFKFTQEIDHTGIPSNRNDETIFEIEIYNTTNTSLLEWATAHSSTTKRLKNGEFLIYNYSDESMLRRIRFENAECIELREGGYKNNKKRNMEKTLVFTFTSKHVTVDEQGFESNQKQKHRQVYEQ